MSEQKLERERIIFEFNKNLSKKLNGLKFSDELSFQQGLVQWSKEYKVQAA